MNNLLQNKFSEKDFIDYVSTHLPDFRPTDSRIETRRGFSVVKQIGESPSMDLVIFSTKPESSIQARMEISKQSYALLKNHPRAHALIAYHADDVDEWRLSLITTQVMRDKNGIKETVSNPRRFSYVLGPKAKVNTPTKYLVSKGNIIDLNDLKERFSLEVVNKDFYREISNLFTKLTGGTHTNGKNKEEYKAMLQLPSVPEGDQRNLEFAVRLIGRVIFCWFLREKKSIAGISLMPKELLSLEATEKNLDYYHSILEPIFFEVLNKQVKSRKDPYAIEHFSSIPYLNGGLFAPNYDDYFSHNIEKQSVFHNTVMVPDDWIKEFFTFLETYNFTIDENVSFDEELSIDPEMLGRIFENLLAEINPETGESARKNTGSYYTPRAIVDYMVDESLFIYLKEKTSIDGLKLRAIISYDIEDDLAYPLTFDEYDKVIDSLSTVKILDPACGSGAFPIGALQKIVFILQQVDPDGRKWFEKQVISTAPEIRRVIEREFANKNFNYIRKLGVIRENIFGVDIQPIATEISRLRCFLTLVVDQSVHDELENRGIEPLPNLDFKFVTANTLIHLPGAQEQTLFKDREGIDQLKDLRNQFFSSTNSERQRLQLEFKELQNQMLDRMIEMKGSDEITRMLSTWSPFSHKGSTWFDPEWMFGIEGGFDVVIANPPWGSDLSKDEKEILKDLYPDIDSSTPNSFAYFIGLGWNLTKGNLSYVLPDSILMKDFARTRDLLCPFLTEISWYQNTGLPEKLKPFVYVEHDVCVVFADKVNKTSKLKTIINKYRAGEDSVVSELQIMEKAHIILKEFDYVYNLAVKDEDLKLLEKLLIHEPLENYLQCHEGIHTGNIREKLFLNQKNGDHCKPLYYGAGTGGDTISNYYSTRSGWWVDYRKEIIEKEKGEYASLRDERIFKYPKIYVTRTGNPFKAFLDEENYSSNNFFSLQIKDYERNTLEELKVFIPFITSKVTQYFIRKFAAPRLGNTFVETKIIHLLRMRVPKLSDHQKASLVKLVDNIYHATETNNQNKIKELEEQISQIIYRLYDLTEEEVALIEKSMPRKQ